MGVHIEELTNKEELLAAYPLIKYLRPDLDKQTYLEYLYEMLPVGYRIFGLYEGEQLASTVLVLKRVDWYMGRHVWLYGLVTAENKRSCGYGKMLIDFVRTWAADNNCEWFGIASESSREEAHRFYSDKVNLKKTHIVFGEEI